MLTTNLIFNDSVFPVSRRHLMNCGLFEKNPTLFISPYQVRSSTSPAIFRQFLDSLEGLPVQLTDSTISLMCDLCEEFEFGPLSLQLCRYLRSHSISTFPDILSRIQTIENRLFHHDRLLSRLSPLPSLDHRLSTEIQSIRQELSDISDHIPSSGYPEVIETLRQELSDISDHIPSSGYSEVIETLRQHLSVEISQIQSEISTLKKRSRSTKPIAPFFSLEKGLPLKLICVGGAYTGKTRFATAFAKGPKGDEKVRADQDFIPRIVKVGKKSVEVHLWNMVQLESIWSSVAQTYCHGVHGFLLFYATDQPDSIYGIEEMFEPLRGFVAKGTKAMIIAWKAPGKQRLGEGEGQVMAIRENMLFAEVHEDYQEIENVIVRLAQSIIESK
jgi:hypothetical protein